MLDVEMAPTPAGTTCENGKAPNPERRDSRQESSRAETLLILDAFLRRSLSSNDTSPLRCFYENDFPTIAEFVGNEKAKSAPATTLSEAGQDKNGVSAAEISNGTAPTKRSTSPVKRRDIAAQMRRTAIRPRSYSEAVRCLAPPTGKRCQSLDSKLPYSVNVAADSPSKSSKKWPLTALFQQIRFGRKLRKMESREKNALKKSRSLPSAPGAVLLSDASDASMGNGAKGGMAQHARMVPSSMAMGEEVAQGTPTHKGLSDTSPSTSISDEEAETNASNRKKKSMLSRLKSSFSLGMRDSNLSKSAPDEKGKRKFSFYSFTSKAKKSYQKEEEEEERAAVKEKRRLAPALPETGGAAPSVIPDVESDDELVVADGSSRRASDHVDRTSESARSSTPASNDRLAPPGTPTRPAGFKDVLERVDSTKGLDCILLDDDGLDPSIRRERRVSMSSLSAVDPDRLVGSPTPSEPIAVPSSLHPPRVFTQKVSPVYADSYPFYEQTPEEKCEIAAKIAAKLEQLCMRQETHGAMSPRSSREMDMYQRIMEQLKSNTMSTQDTRETRSDSFRDCGGTDGPSSLEKEICDQINLNIEAVSTDRLSKVIQPRAILDLISNDSYVQFSQTADDQAMDSRHQDRLTQLALVFGLTKLALLAVGIGSTAAKQMKSYFTQYIQDKFAEIVVGPEGWEMVMKDEECSSQSSSEEGDMPID
ncbi:PREDICTED: uncharacterized protein LOC106821402 [Priapulus caudatus]|uniref:Uncharacterized protein LOC106821402 n=1 Tax=Priapulus caudatus TaxID=37621 RepID=A0ABM1FB35_PRICU|nr:PREDICTED: uncharacterized protein LOC106821402 [Priapulus caudatus]